MGLVSFDEAGGMLDEIVDALPQDLFKHLNGGVNLLPDLKIHPLSHESGKLYILGEYIHDPRGLGRYILIYYGSIIKTYAYLQPSQLKEELRRTLLHEITHHMESLAGERGLEVKDAVKLEAYRRRAVK